METLLLFIIKIFELYFLIGFFYAFYLLMYKLNKIDDGTKQTSIGFKILIFPGLCVFWIFFFFKKYNQH